VDIVILSAKEEENEPGMGKKVYPTI